MDASVSIPVASGTYVLRVDGVGNGSPVNGGWSDYDSLGQYTLTSSGCPAATPNASPTPSATATPVPQAVVVKRTPPGVPTGLSVTPGAPAGAKTILLRWAAPASTGGSAITGFRLQGLQVDSHGRTIRSVATSVGPSVRAITVTLGTGTYKLRVEAVNALGGSAWTAYSRTVAPR